MIDGNSVDFANAKTYRKKLKVIAFPMTHGATYDKQATWNTLQTFPGPHMVVVGSFQESDEWAGGRLIKSDDVYGVAVQEFRDSYELIGGGAYCKRGVIRAVEMAEPFTVSTRTADGNNEVDGATGEAGDFVVSQGENDRYHIKRADFLAQYELVEEGT